MFQRQQILTGQLMGCPKPNCGLQPKAYESLGKHLHHLECNPCGIRTAKMPTLQEAVELWEAQDVNNTTRGT